MFAAGRTILAPESLRFRLFAAFSLLTLLISATFTLTEIRHQIRLFRTQSVEKAALLSQHLSSQVRLPLYAGDRETVAMHSREIARQQGVHRVTVCDASGALVADIVPSGTSAKDNFIKGETPVFTGDFGPSIDQLMSGAQEEQTPIGRVVIEMNDAELNRHIRSIVLTSMITGFIYWLIFIGIALFIVRWATRSLQPLVHGIRALHDGDYTARIQSVGQDELADAAASINDLANALQMRDAENARLQQELADSMKNEVREERRKIMAKLIQTNRMTSLGLLVSGAAHEINTPNGAIRLAGQKFGRVWRDAVPVLDRVAADEGDFVLGGLNYSHARIEVTNSLELINRCTGRIEQVLKNLREYSIGEQSRLFEETSVNRVVEDALTIITAHKQMERIFLDRQLNEDIPPVKGNRFQLGQVIINLLLNAMQAIPEEMIGSIAVMTGVDEKTGDVTVTVRDNGKGIPEEIRNRLMEPFFTTRLDKGGSGLGLYISHYLIGEHNGSLTFESMPGEGTRFTVRLPAAGNHATATPTDPSSPTTFSTSAG